MFDNKLMLLLFLGIAIFLLTRPPKNSKNVTNDETTESESSTNTLAERFGSHENIKYKKHQDLMEARKRELSESVENFDVIENFGSHENDRKPQQGLTDSRGRVSSEFPFPKKENLKDNSDVPFPAIDPEEIVNEDAAEDIKEHVRSLRVDVEGRDYNDPNAYGDLLDGQNPNMIPTVKTNELQKGSHKHLLPKHNKKSKSHKGFNSFKLNDDKVLNASNREHFGYGQSQSIKGSSRDLRGESGDLINPISLMPMNNSSIAATAHLSKAKNNKGGKLYPYFQEGNHPNTGIVGCN